MEVPEELKKILSEAEISDYQVSDTEVKFEYTQMYVSPKLNFNLLKKISEFFGTEDIDVDNDIAITGCETCDYNSEYGHTVYVRNYTKGVDK